MEFIRSKKSTLSLDMAPLIDVVFQLLIFFMLGSSFIRPAIKINLPKAVTQDKRDVERIVVSIDKAGVFFVNKNQVSEENLKNEIQGRISSGTGKSVDLQIDAEVSYRYFIKAFDALRQAGVSQINIAHEGEGKR